MPSYKNQALNLDQAYGIIDELEEQVKVLQKCLTSSLEIQAGQGVEVKCSQLEDVLQEENDDLFIKLETAKEALEFYADSDNWLESDDNDNRICGTITSSDLCDPNICNYQDGGKRAKEALKEIYERT